MRRGYVNVQTPLAPKSLAAMLTVHLFVDPLLSFMYGSNMFCHVALAREHFLAVGARNALNTAVFSLSHMNVPDMGAKIGFC